MNRKKTTRTISHLNGIKRTTELNNNDELNKDKHIYSNGVRKKALNEDLLGRKMKVNLDYQDYEDEKIDFIRNEEVIEHAIKPRKNKHQENWHQESKYEVDNNQEGNRVGEIYNDNLFEDDNEQEYDSYENDEELENDYEEEYFEDEDTYEEEYQETCSCGLTKCEECRKISKLCKIGIIIFLILLAGVAGYVISFFDGLVH